MGKYADLIEKMHSKAGGFQGRVYDALIKADGRARLPLERALLSHPNDDVRHDCAEILGERGSAKSIPTLIEALGDPVLYVRQDALWSICKICHMQTWALMMWLDLHYDEDYMSEKKKVDEWWTVNKRFIENNDNFEW